MVPPDTKDFGTKGEIGSYDRKLMSNTNMTNLATGTLIQRLHTDI